MLPLRGATAAAAAAPEVLDGADAGQQAVHFCFSGVKGNVAHCKQARTDGRTGRGKQ